MLAEKTLQQLAGMLKDSDGNPVTVDLLKEAIASQDELTLDVPRLFTQEEADQLAYNKGKEREAEGKKQGSQIAIKAFKEAFGVDIEGKDTNEVAKAAREKILADAKIEPEKRLSELQSDLEKLQGKYKIDLELKEKELTGLKTNLFQTRVNNEILNHIPGDDKLHIPRQKVLTLFNSDYDVKEEDGKVVVFDRKTSEAIKNDVGSPLSVDEVVKSYVEKEKLVKTAGMGGGDKGDAPSEFKSRKEAIEWMQSNGQNPMAPENMTKLAKINN